MQIIIRSLQQNDFPNWLPLWNANNLGQIDEVLTTETWSRLTDDNHPVNGICAIVNGEMAGLVHYVLHPTTGAIEPICYMQDLFVSEKHRQKGIARKMVKELIIIGEKENWGRLYWLADENNEAAQALYKNIGVKMNFSLFIQPLGTL